MITLGGSVETPQNHVMVCVVSEFPDEDVMEQAAVCTKNVSPPGLQHPPLYDHDKCTAIPLPWFVAWEEDYRHVLQYHI